MSMMIYLCLSDMTESLDKLKVLIPGIDCISKLFFINSSFNDSDKFQQYNAWISL